MKSELRNPTTTVLHADHGGVCFTSSPRKSGTTIGMPIKILRRWVSWKSESPFSWLISSATKTIISPNATVAILPTLSRWASLACGFSTGW